MAKIDDGFNEKGTSILIRMYDAQPISVDKLPHTQEFERMQAEFCAQSRLPMTQRQVHQKLVDLRKAKLLRPKHRRNKTSKFNQALIDN